MWNPPSFVTLWCKPLSRSLSIKKNSLTHTLPAKTRYVRKPALKFSKTFHITEFDVNGRVAIWTLASQVSFSFGCTRECTFVAIKKEFSGVRTWGARSLNNGGKCVPSERAFVYTPRPVGVRDCTAVRSLQLARHSLPTAARMCWMLKC